MIYIAHRALFDGPNPENENRLEQIDLAISNGFDVEIDLRFIENKWWLGHDGPTYLISDIKSFVNPRIDHMWIHCKNHNALFELANIDFESSPNYFWHQEDDFTLTNRGYIWTYPRKPLDQHLGILVQPEWDENWKDYVPMVQCAGICSKLVSEIRFMIDRH